VKVNEGNITLEFNFDIWESSAR